MGFDCTFFQPQKKRGPTGHRVKQIRQQQADLPGPGSQASTPDVAPRAPPNGELAPAEPIQMLNAHWDTYDRVSTPVFEPGSDSTALITGPGQGWNADGCSAGWQTNVAAACNEQSNLEHWLPADMGTQIPILDFPGSNIYLKPSLPSVVQTAPDGSNLDPYAVESQSTSMPSFGALQPPIDYKLFAWPVSINEANMIPWIDVYFDRLHPTLPLLNRSSLVIRMLSQEHRKNPQFGSMLLSLCAFSLTQPIEIHERPTASSRASQARVMMHEATKMRSSSEFGEHPTIEAVLTSFFLFGCLFGSNQHNAASIRLREALDIAAALGLNDPDSYYNLPSEETGQRLRTYLVLSITERAYALQQRHLITFWGKPGAIVHSVNHFISNATQSLVSGVIVHNQKDAEGMLGLARLMELFDAIDEDVIGCWNRRCDINGGYCGKLTKAKVLNIHANLSAATPSEQRIGYDWPGCTKAERNVLLTMRLTETQCADVLITQKWLQNRIWVLSSTHGLLSDQPGCEEQLSINYPITVAKSTLRICQSLRLSAMEAHGIGLIEKLFDIASNAVAVLYNARTSLGTPAQTSEAITSTAVTSPGGRVEVGPMETTAPMSQNLAEAFLLLLSSLRGGNHPFLGRYKTQLRSLHAVRNASTGWIQQ